MNSFSYKKIFNKKNVLIVIVAIILSVLATFTFSVAHYSKTKSNLKILLKQNDIINKISINNSEIPLTSFSNDSLVLVQNTAGDETSREYLLCKKNYEISLNVSVIDDVLINLNSENVYLKKVEIWQILKVSLSVFSLAAFFISFAIIVIVLYVLLRVLNKVRKNVVNIIDIPVFIISIFIIYISNIYLLMWISKFLAIIPVLAITIFISYYLKLKLKEWHNVFFIITSVIGISMIFIVPPGNVPDEPAHYIRSFSELNSYVHCDENAVNLPVNLESFIQKFSNNVHLLDAKYSGSSFLSELLKEPDYKLLSESKTTYDNTRYLSFLPYMPAGIVNFVGRILGIPVLVLFNLSRLSNFIISTMICFVAIKITPRFKKIFVVVSLFPIFLQQAAGINMDYLTNSVAFLLLAIIFKYKYEEVSIGKKQITYLSTLSIVLALCKFGYFPLLLLVLILPNEKFKSKKLTIIFKVAIIILPIVISYMFNFGSVSLPNDKTDYYTISKVLSNPINSMKICLRTLLMRFDLDVFRGLIDGFGWSTKYHIPFVFASISSIFIILLFTDSAEEDKVSFKARMFMLTVYFIIFAELYAIAFTEWTRIELNSINGLQSRYFIPIVMLFYIAISNKAIRLNVKDKYRLYFVLLSIAEILSITSILHGFY